MQVQVLPSDGKIMPIVNKDKTFSNPWDTWSDKGATDMIKFAFSEKPQRSRPPMNDQELETVLPVKTPNFDLAQDATEDIVTTWLGHASVLVQMDGINFLTDPVFADRASPVGFVGPKRYRPAPCELSELPPISFIVISHDHYDHLDLEVVRFFGDSVRWFVGLGLKAWFASVGVTNVEELNWWDETTFQDIKIAALPCQHWSKRSIWNQRTTLWCGWAIISPKHRVFFAGDTGYCSVFPAIGKNYGPFDLSLIPIGCYTPREFLKCQHVNPEEAVIIHQQVESKLSLGIHWGTYAMGISFRYEAEDEPPQDLAKAMKDRAIPSNQFICKFIGETFSVQQHLHIES